VRRVFHAQNLKLVEALQEGDARNHINRLGRVRCRLPGSRALGLVGEVKRVNLAPIEASLQAGSIPVIASLGETGGQILNINADFAANELVKVLQPYKIVFLTGTGGCWMARAVIDSINVHRIRAADAAAVDQWRHAVKIEQIKDLLDSLPLTSSVSITRPAELAKELFTHKGSGTLVRRGERVLQCRRGRNWICAPAWTDRVGVRPRVLPGLLRAHRAAVVPT
jgi:acetylglutamate synthase